MYGRPTTHSRDGVLFRGYVRQVASSEFSGSIENLMSVYCAGSLDRLLFDSQKQLDDKDKIHFAKGIARGMLHLHNHNIVHRDLAARNILLSGHSEPKISVRFVPYCK